MNILCGDVPQIDAVDPGAVIHVVGHAGHSRYEIELQRGIAGKFCAVAGLSRKLTNAHFAELSESLRIVEPDLFLYLKETGTASNADRL